MNNMTLTTIATNNIILSLQLFQRYYTHILGKVNDYNIIIFKRICEFLKFVFGDIPRLIV